MSDRQIDGLRVVAVVGGAVCIAIAVIAIAAALMAASHEVRQFLGNARDVTVFAIVAGLIVWASKHGMRT